MKHHGYTLIAALFAVVTLVACSKEPTNEAPAQATAPAANETAANASGTTTYYGSADEQAQAKDN
jgi:uncharacterized lipoprotein YbaY